MTNLYPDKKGLFLYAFLACLLSSMAVLKYYNLNSTFFDLGVFINNFYMISVGHWQRIFLTHVQPYGLIYSLPYHILPDFLFPPIILITQASLLTLPVFGLYKYYGPVPAIAFSLYFPVWYNALFDFHIDHLAVPLLFAFFFFERQGKTGLAIIMAILLAFVKEIFALQAAFCGLFLVFSRKKRTAGTCLFLFGVIYFYIASHYLQRYFNLFDSDFTGSPTAHFFENPSNWMGTNEVEILMLIFSRLHLILWEILTNPDKMKYLFYIFCALGFIPFLKPGILLVSLPILAGSLFFQIEVYHGFTHHYTAGLIAPLIIAFAEGLPLARNYWGKLRFPTRGFIPVVIFGLLLCHIVISPSPIGRKFYQQKSWFHNSNVYIFQERSQWIKSEIERLIPSDEKVILSIQNTMNWGYLAQRQDVFIFPHGATKPTIIKSNGKDWAGLLEYVQRGEIQKYPQKKMWADYVILDLKRPWFIGDRGCHWITGKCENGKLFENEFLSLVGRTKELFSIIYENDGFMIMKRRVNEKLKKYPSALNTTES
jgi:uncharacterized membrane protein